MSIEGIVRVSFQSDIYATQDTNRALVGHPQHSRGLGPFTRVGTAAYVASKENDVAVLEALSMLSRVLSDHSASLDFVSITIVRRKARR